MFGFQKDQFVYIQCPKNGCMTHSGLLERHGWQKFNLFEHDLDLSKLFLWGHLTDPHQRHTKGIDQYLIGNPDLDINNPQLAKMLISGVFDEHTYSLHMMLGSIWHLPIHWIPLDVEIIKWNQYPIKPQLLTGDDLTNDFFKEHNIDIHVTKLDYRNVQGHLPNHREKITDLKNEHPDNYNKIVKNFLETDIILYTKVVESYREKYLKPENFNK